VVQKGGEEFNIYLMENGMFEAFLNASFYKPMVYQFQFVPFFGTGKTILEAVDNALAKVHAAESVEASVQEGKREV